MPTCFTTSKSVTCCSLRVIGLLSKNSNSSDNQVREMTVLLDLTLLLGLWIWLCSISSVTGTIEAGE